MRLGNASTTVTGTVTPASVNTRVIPHLRPTRPMVIFNPHTAGAAMGPDLVATGQRFGYARPQDPWISLRGAAPWWFPLDNWRRHPRAPTSKMDGGVYILQALRASFYSADAAPPD